jgi:hypothetical protein
MSRVPDPTGIMDAVSARTRVDATRAGLDADAARAGRMRMAQTNAHAERNARLAAQRDRLIGDAFDLERITCGPPVAFGSAPGGTEAINRVVRQVRAVDKTIRDSALQDAVMFVRSGIGGDTTAQRLELFRAICELAPTFDTPGSRASAARLCITHVTKVVPMYKHGVPEGAVPPPSVIAAILSLTHPGEDAATVCVLNTLGRIACGGPDHTNAVLGQNVVACVTNILIALTADATLPSRTTDIINTDVPLALTRFINIVSMYGDPMVTMELTLRGLDLLKRVSEGGRVVADEGIVMAILAVYDMTIALVANAERPAFVAAQATSAAFAAGAVGDASAGTAPSTDLRTSVVDATKAAECAIFVTRMFNVSAPNMMPTLLDVFCRNASLRIRDYVLQIMSIIGVVGNCARVDYVLCSLYAHPVARREFGIILHEAHPNDVSVGTAFQLVHTWAVHCSPGVIHSHVPAAMINMCIAAVGHVPYAARAAAILLRKVHPRVASVVASDRNNLSRLSNASTFMSSTATMIAFYAICTSIVKACSPEVLESWRNCRLIKDGADSHHALIRNSLRNMALSPAQRDAYATVYITVCGFMNVLWPEPRHGSDWSEAPAGGPPTASAPVAPSAPPTAQHADAGAEVFSLQDYRSSIPVGVACTMVPTGFQEASHVGRRARRHRGARGEEEEEEEDE